MTSIDHALQQVRVGEVELAALCFVAAPGTAPTGPDAESAWEALATAGIATKATMPGWAAELGQIIAAPGLHLVIELFAAEAVILHHIWATPHRAVVGTTDGSGLIGLHGLETAMIPYEVARLTGLGPRPSAATDQPIAVAVSTLATAEQAAVTGDTESARRALTGDGVSPDDAGLLTDMWMHRRLSWRVTAIWRSSPDDVQANTLVVTDGGDCGMWISEAADEHAEATLTLHPSSPSQIWHRLLALLPPGTQPGSPSA